MFPWPKPQFNRRNVPDAPERVRQVVTGVEVNKNRTPGSAQPSVYFDPEVLDRMEAEILQGTDIAQLLGLLACDSAIDPKEIT